MKEPWDGAGMAATSVGTLVGAVVILVAWWGTSGTGDVSAQSRFLNVAVAGLLVAHTNLVLWLMRGRRAVGRRRRALLADVPSRQLDRAPVVSEDVPAGTVWVTGAGMTRYHRADCDLVAAKKVRRHRAGVTPARLRPCDICRP